MNVPDWSDTHKRTDVQQTNGRNNINCDATTQLFAKDVHAIETFLEAPFQLPSRYRRSSLVGSPRKGTAVRRCGPPRLTGSQTGARSQRCRRPHQRSRAIHSANHGQLGKPDLVVGCAHGPTRCKRLTSSEWIHGNLQDRYLRPRRNDAIENLLVARSAWTYR